MEIIRQSVTDHQILLVNTARALKYSEDFGQRQSVIQNLGEIPSSPRQF